MVDSYFKERNTYASEKHFQPLHPATYSSPSVNFSGSYPMGEADGFTERWSSNHNLRLLGRIDVGGPFWLERWDSVLEPLRYKNSATLAGSKYSYDGAIAGTVLAQSPGSISFSIDLGVLKTDGATAVSRADPTKSVGSLSVLMGETIKEGIPALAGMNLIKERSNLLRGSGSEYLNTQFGWLPIISDVKKLAFAVKNHHEILNDFVNGSKKVTRSGFAFPSVKTVTSFSQSNSLSISRAPGSTVNGNLFPQPLSSVETTTLKDRWFEGAYSYYVPLMADGQSKFDQYAAYADKLLGVELTPETLWNLAPWTWAIDWFGNAGDVIHNLTSLGLDGTVLRYGYIMDHQSMISVQTDSVRVKPTVGTISVGTPCGRRMHIHERKLRYRASPFGFGVTFDGFSDRQVAIIAALGLSRT